MELIGPTQYVRCLLYTHKTCVPCKRVEYSNTDGRLIKQLIKARELGSETRRLSFGKNCSTHRREGEEREKGLRGGRKRISAIGQECVKICPLPATPATNTNTPQSPLLLFLCRFSVRIFTHLKNVLKSKAAAFRAGIPSQKDVVRMCDKSARRSTFNVRPSPECRPAVGTLFFFFFFRSSVCYHAKLMLNESREP